MHVIGVADDAELCGLRRRDVDVKSETVTVRRQLVEVNGALSFGPPKTAAGRRTVTLPSFVMRSLVVHMDLYSEPGLDGLVFPALEGGPMRRSNFRRRVWLTATESAGVRGLRFHDLRHTGATLAAASGASLRALMSRIGHTSAAAAIRYQHVLDGQDAEIASFLDQLATDHEEANDTVTDRQVPRVKVRYPADTLTPVPT